MQPHSTHQAKVAKSDAMKNLSGGSPPPRRSLERYGGRYVESLVDGVGKRHVVQEYVINHLSPRNGALLLLFGPNKMAVRALFAKADRQLPPTAVEKSTIVRTGTLAACALHANHGRALTCGNSTLRPGILEGKKETQAR
jgi:hypothetical protein